MNLESKLNALAEMAALIEGAKNPVRTADEHRAHAAKVAFAHIASTSEWQEARVEELEQLMISCKNLAARKPGPVNR